MKRFFFIFLAVMLIVSPSRQSFSESSNLVNFLKKRRAAKEKVYPTPSSQRKLLINGVERNYDVFLPKNYNRENVYPVLIVFHGGGGNAHSIVKKTRILDYVDDYNFILITPNGTGRQNKEKFLTWNAYNCCGYALDSDADDVNFVDSLITQTSIEYNVDLNRIYLTGMSNGAMINFKLACQLSNKIAGIAPVAGSMNTENCNPKKPISVIMFNGTADNHVRYEGGNPLKTIDIKHRRVDNSVYYAVDFWAKNNKCNYTPNVIREGNIIKAVYDNCTNNKNVVVYTIINGTHAWPGGQKGFMGDEPTKEINATEIIIKSFFGKN